MCSDIDILDYLLTADDEGEPETFHRLSPSYALNINSPLRHVRTRIYFTSESHIHGLINVLRHGHLDCNEESTSKAMLSDDQENALLDMPEFDYLTHIVFRMFENVQVSHLISIEQIAPIRVVRSAAIF